MYPWRITWVALWLSRPACLPYPAVSCAREDASENPPQVAFLQAVFPTESKNSRYLLMVMNGDGTGQRQLFPAEGQSGFEKPLQPVWAPVLSENGGDYISIIYEGNLWILDSSSGQSQQVTGDGLTIQLDWK